MSNAILRRLLGLGLPPFLFCWMDAALTLHGQAAEYWAGNRELVNEASPTFNHLLQIHPLAFVAGNLVWAAIFLGIIVLLPESLALLISIAVTFGHATGAATWVVYRSEYGYQLANGLCLLSAVALMLGIAFGYRNRKAGAYALDRWPWAVRAVLSVVLFCIGVYLFLVPH